MRVISSTVMFAASLLLSANALARGDDLQDLQLAWTPNTTLSEMGPLDVSGALLTTPINFDTFVDQRENPSLIGENREDAAKARTVKTSADIPAFMSTHMRDLARAAGANVSDAPDAIRINADVRQFFVIETDNYRGQISLLVHVRDPKGKELWTGIINGGAENYGRSFRADNYNETISNMLMRATYNLLASASFRESLGKH